MPRPFTRFTKIALVIWVIVVVAQVVAIGGTYLLYSRHYVSTANAQVDGDEMDINAPATGTVVKWSIGPGSSVESGQPVGRIRLDSGSVRPELIIRSPGTAQIALSRAVEGQHVQVGTQLAVAYPSGIYVTARVRVNDVGKVRLAAPVTIEADAFPDVTVNGVVSRIQGATAGEFTVYPSPDQNVANPQPVAEYVPVRIDLTRTAGLALTPGMNVTVHIRRDPPA